MVTRDKNRIYPLWPTLRGPMKSSTCSDHAVHSSERSDASKIIVHQVAGMGKGESVLRRDSLFSTSHDIQDNEYNGPERLKSEEQFVSLPGHPFYGRQVTILERRTSGTYTRCVIEDPAHLGFHYHIPERWLSTSPPPPEPTRTTAHCPICLPLPALDRMVQIILIKDRTGRARGDDSPDERDRSRDLGKTATQAQSTAQRASLLPGSEAGRRDLP
jgi:hypothetical protein